MGLKNSVTWVLQLCYRDVTGELLGFYKRITGELKGSYIDATED